MKLVETDEPAGAVPPPGAGAVGASLPAEVAVEVSSMLNGRARWVCSAIALWGAGRAAGGPLATVCVGWLGAGAGAADVGMASDTSELGGWLETMGSLCAAASGSGVGEEADVPTLGEDGVLLRETGA
jgi:hypothetical protein